MTRLILSLLALALVAIPVGIQWAPPVTDRILGDDAIGVLALRGGDPNQIRLYATYEDPLSNVHFANESPVGWYAVGDRWRFVVDGADAGSISLDFGTPQTITTTAAQDASLTRILTKINAERVAAKLTPYATREAWLRDILVGAVQSYREQAAKADAEDACVTYNAASAAIQNGIKTALGGKSPCP